MTSLKMVEGELQFDGSVVAGIEEFLQRLVNSLKIYNIECYYNENLGLDIRILNEIDEPEYKLQHIKEKVLSWYGEELNNFTYKLISTTNRTIKAIFYFEHKKYNSFEKEVLIKNE